MLPLSHTRGKEMSDIDSAGLITHPRVRLRRFTNIERGALARIEGIIVHQTDTVDEGASSEATAVQMPMALTF